MMMMMMMNTSEYKRLHYLPPFDLYFNEFVTKPPDILPSVHIIQIPVICSQMQWNLIQNQGKEELLKKRTAMIHIVQNTDVVANTQRKNNYVVIDYSLTASGSLPKKLFA